MMDVRIREARSEDAGALTEIAHAAKRSWGYPEAWVQSWSATLTLDADAIATMRVRVAEDDAGILGFRALAGEGRSMRLEHLWVWPDAMGRGVGRALVEDARAEAAGRGAEVLVIESDPHAEVFYRRLGAITVGAVPAPAPGAPDRSLPVMHLPVGRGSPSPDPHQPL
jgi:GNAT superfamily N-acetyltransferase